MQNKTKQNEQTNKTKEINKMLYKISKKKIVVYIYIYLR
jgi:hypothetical protein